MPYKIKAFAKDAAPSIDTRSEAEIIREANIMRGEVMAQLIGRAVDFVRKIRTNIDQAFEQARTMRELAKLDDRSLADIGLTRSDIPAFAMRAVRTETTETVEPVQAQVEDEQPRIAA